MKSDRDAEPALHVAQQVDDLGLHRDVERRDRLVAHEHVGVERERAGDADALALSAGELVRKAAQHVGVRGRRGRAARRRARARAAPADPVGGGDRFRDDVAAPSSAGSSDVYGSWKIICTPLAEPLAVAAPAAGDVASAVARVPASGRLESDEHPGQGRLAAARLADDAEHLAGVELQARPRRRPRPSPAAATDPVAKVLVEPGRLQQRRGAPIAASRLRGRRRTDGFECHSVDGFTDELLGSEAGGAPAGSDLREEGTAVRCAQARRPSGSGDGRSTRAGCCAGLGGEPGMVSRSDAAHRGLRHRAQQRLGVRMRGMLEHGVGVAALDDPSGVHDGQRCRRPP